MDASAASVDFVNCKLLIKLDKNNHKFIATAGYCIY